MTPEVIADVVDAVGLVGLLAAGAYGLLRVVRSRAWAQLACRVGEHDYDAPAWSRALGAPWRRCKVCGGEWVLRVDTEPMDWGWERVERPEEGHDG